MKHPTMNSGTNSFFPFDDQISKGRFTSTEGDFDGHIEVTDFVSDKFGLYSNVQKVSTLL